MVFLLYQHRRHLHGSQTLLSAYATENNGRTMKRLVWHGNHNFVLEQTSGPLPVPAAHEVLLKIRAVGICGTDIHILRGNVPFSRPPLVLGHEISGEVVAIGD